MTTETVHRTDDAAVPCLIEAEPDQLPASFRLALPDDALAPAYPAGSLFIWSTAKTPRVGSVVLVRDEAGQVIPEVWPAPAGFVGDLLAVAEYECIER